MKIETVMALILIISNTAYYIICVFSNYFVDDMYSNYFFGFMKKKGEPN